MLSYRCLEQVVFKHGQRMDYTCETKDHFRFTFIFLHQTGDCLAAGFIAAALKGLKQDAAVAAGLQAAISCSTND